MYTMFTSKSQKEKLLQVDVTISGQRITMDINTEVSLCIINEDTYHQLWSRDNTPQLRAATVVLSTYTGEHIINWIICSTTRNFLYSILILMVRYLVLWSH